MSTYIEKPLLAFVQDTEGNLGVIDGLETDEDYIMLGSILTATMATNPRLRDFLRDAVTYFLCNEKEFEGITLRDAKIGKNSAN